MCKLEALWFAVIHNCVCVWHSAFDFGESCNWGVFLSANMLNIDAVWLILSCGLCVCVCVCVHVCVCACVCVHNSTAHLLLMFCRSNAHNFSMCVWAVQVCVCVHERSGWGVYVYHHSGVGYVLGKWMQIWLGSTAASLQYENLSDKHITACCSIMLTNLNSDYYTLWITKEPAVCWSCRHVLHEGSNHCADSWNIFGCVEHTVLFYYVLACSWKFGHESFHSVLRVASVKAGFLFVFLAVNSEFHCPVCDLIFRSNPVLWMLLICVNLSYTECFINVSNRHGYETRT